MFNNKNIARMFVLLRNPLERVISKYYANLTNHEVADMTLTQYIRSGGRRVENNYLTRSLSGRLGGEVKVYHLDLARELLRRKFVVGLADDFVASVNLFHRCVLCS